MDLDSSIRLNKYISDSGHCSRREADRLIESNRVRVNGKRPEVGTRVEDGDEVTVDGMLIYGGAASKANRVYIAYNKPVGITCTTESAVKGNIVEAVDHDQRVFPIGRLDKPSDGLILLTSDGDIVNKILRAENAHDKEYLVSVDKPVASDFASKMQSGIPILGTVTKPCKVTVTGRQSFRIILQQGLNRQIRRMCEYLGYEVRSLTRIRIMNIELGKLRPGAWRNLTKDEMALLKAAVEKSSKVEKSSQKNQPNKRRSGSGRPGNTSSKHTEAKRTGAKKGAAGNGKSLSSRKKAERGHAAKHSESSHKGQKTNGKKAGKRAASRPNDARGKAKPKGRKPAKAQTGRARRK